ncbi:MAG: hypothetical protein WKF54_13325 [Nocardioidaceae bacterium]
MADSQHGLFARHQAIAAGYTEREFAHLTRPGNGLWVRVRYGIYTVRADWVELSDDARRRLIDQAALLVCDAGTVLSHSSAARRLGLPLYGADDGLTHVTRLRTHDRHLSRIEAGIKHHSGQVDEGELVRLDDVVVTEPIRTVLDLAREFGYRTGMVAADAALAAGASHDDLMERALCPSAGSKAPLLRALAQEADGRARSPLETLGRILLGGMGITDLELQHEVRLVDGGKAKVDLYSPALHHVFECDGRLKYREQLDLRGQRVSPQDVLWVEKLREDKIRGLGFGFSRMVWHDVMAENMARTSTRLWREIRQQAEPHGVQRLA